MMSEIIILAAAAALNCGNPITQADISQCAYADYLAADAELNRQWAITSRAMRRMDQGRDTSYDKRPGYFTALLAAQRAWLRFRDAHCVSQGYQMRGGSGEGMVVSLCRETLTRSRIDQLRKTAESL